MKTKDVLNGVGKFVTVQQRFPVDRQSQLTGLLSEISCLSYSHALFSDMTYQFIECHIATHGEPPFPIPKMRFVRSALAYEQGTSMQIFLVEELIDEEKEGGFRKYLHNGSASPLFHSGEDGDRAAFLAFSQHLQYWKTAKMIFVTDYQGKPPDSGTLALL